MNDVQHAGQVQAALEWQGSKFGRWGGDGAGANSSEGYSESQESEKGLGREHDDWKRGRWYGWENEPESMSRASAGFYRVWEWVIALVLVYITA